jgi:hypothetical protein
MAPAFEHAAITPKMNTAAAPWTIRWTCFIGSPR